jgi:plasmid maintenance system antidote protein VapI
LAKALGIPVSFWLKRQSDYDAFLERKAFGGHEDVWIEVDDHQQHVLGDPNMSEETKKALAEMIKAVTKAIDKDGWWPEF